MHPHTQIHLLPLRDLAVLHLLADLTQHNCRLPFKDKEVGLRVLRGTVVLTLLEEVGTDIADTDSGSSIELDILTFHEVLQVDEDVLVLTTSQRKTQFLLLRQLDLVV
jgi:hypothetical protein